MRTGRNNSTRRERLLEEVVAIVSEHGYENATVTQLVSRAGVSRASFYEHFASKEACFLVALEDVERDVRGTVTRRIEAQRGQAAAVAAIAAIARFAHEHPVRASALMNATMAAGPLALDARDRGVDAIARLIDDGDPCVDASGRAPALSSAILIGTAYRLLGSRLRRGKHERDAMRDDLLDWIAAYEDHAGAARWQSLTVVPAPARAPLLARAPLRAPPALTPGRPRRSTPAVAENQRLRIIFATAEITRRDGYPAASVAEITRAAGVDSRVFYELFADKHSAFGVLREFAFQQAMAVSAGAFFAVEDWPRRIWEAARALTHFLEQNPALTYTCVVESDAGGPRTIERFEDLVAGCTIFLQEGYRYLPSTNRTQPSRVVLDAIAQAELEIIYRQARKGSSSDMAATVGQLAYICLAPFVGAARAAELVDEMGSS